MNVKLGEDVVALLKADADVSAVVGDRVYFGEAPQGVVAPYLVVFHIDSTPEETHDDFQGLDGTTLQTNSYGSSPKISIGLRMKVRAAYAGSSFRISRPAERSFKENSVELWCAQLDGIFWHNPTQTN